MEVDGAPPVFPDLPTDMIDAMIFKCARAGLLHGAAGSRRGICLKWDRARKLPARQKRDGRMALIFDAAFLEFRRMGQSLFPYIRVIMPDQDRERRHYASAQKNFAK